MLAGNTSLNNLTGRKVVKDCPGRGASLWNILPGRLRSICEPEVFLISNYYLLKGIFNHLQEILKFSECGVQNIANLCLALKYLPYFFISLALESWKKFQYFLSYYNNVECFWKSLSKIKLGIVLDF